MSDLYDWLRGACPSDILMPTSHGTKHPRFKHAHGVWSWYMFHCFVRTHEVRKAAAKPAWSTEAGVGVLLRTLCVIDIDCMAVALELERRHPVLTRVPTERTSKGKHYFFRRSAKADRDGYYDGARQQMASVDFKTVCSNGTSGFIVVAPSPGKVWERAPWEVDQLQEIPDNLLELVARARHPAISMDVTFLKTQETISVLDSSALSKLAYAQMFTDEDGPSQFKDEPMPVPYGSAREFTALLSLLDGSPCLAPERIEHEGHGVLWLGNFLGAPVPVLQRAEHSGREMLRLHRVHERMAAHVFREDRGDRDLLHVDALLASEVRRERLDFGHSAVFRPSIGRSVPNGALVLHRDPVARLEEVLEGFVLDALRRHAGHLIVAGGAVLDAVTDLGPSGDVDMYIVGSTPERASGILDDLLADRRAVRAFRTGNAVTIFTTDADVPVQVILQLCDSPEAVLYGFDLEPCRACGLCDSQGGLHVRASPSWVESVRTAAFPVRSNKWSSSTTLRVAKYSSKGLQAYLPGLDRTLVPRLRGVCGHDALARCLKNCEGASELVCAERVLQSMYLQGVTEDAVRHLSRFMYGCRRSDYETTVESGLMYWVMSTLEWVRGVVRSEPVARTAPRCEAIEAGFDRALLHWRTANPGRSVNSFFPAEANFDKVVSDSQS
jgi:hypothetical protein